MNDTSRATEPEAPAMFRLIYRSRRLVEPAESRTELAEIFTAARRNNRKLGVTGALMLSGEAFVQVLEGDEAVVRDLYAAISADRRHTDLHVLEEEAVDGRTFGRWAMAEVSTDGRSDIRLMSNAQKGVIVAAPGVDGSITPEQETVLAFMRGTMDLSPLEQ